MNRSTFNDQYTAWIKEKILSEYRSDVSMALIYGSYINGTAGSKSDVDCYFIPATERGRELARTFLYDDVGYDLFPMDWDRVARIAALEEGLPPLLGDVQVLYCANKADAERFACLQEQLKRNLNDDAFVKNAARKKCVIASEFCAGLTKLPSMCQVRKYAAYSIMLLAEAVALYNHDYYHRGLKMQFSDLKTQFSDLPEEIPRFYLDTTQAVTLEDTIRSARGMLEATLRYMELSPPPVKAFPTKEPVTGPMNADALARLYEELSATFQKIYLCCENGNSVLAFLSAAVLQDELDSAMELGCPEMDMLSAYAPDSLPGFAAAVRAAELALVALIEANGGKLRRYHSFSEFIAEN